MAEKSSLKNRILLVGVGISFLALSYIYQYTDVLTLVGGSNYAPEYHFIINRVFRIVLNDLGMVLIIYALFLEGSVIRLALVLQLIDLVILLPVYLIIKLPTEGVSEISSPFLSQFHRMIVNPILMILLIPAIYYQKLSTK